MIYIPRNNIKFAKLKKKKLLLINVKLIITTVWNLNYGKQKKKKDSAIIIIITKKISMFLREKWNIAWMQTVAKLKLHNNVQWSRELK